MIGKMYQNFNPSFSANDYDSIKDLENLLARLDGIVVIEPHVKRVGVTFMEDKKTVKIVPINVGIESLRFVPNENLSITYFENAIEIALNGYIYKMFTAVE